MNAFDCESVKTGTIAYLLAKRMSAQKPLIEFFLSTQTELWQTWCMRRTENPENVVRFHEAPQMKEEEFFDMVLTQNSKLVKEVAESILNAVTCEKDASITKIQLS